MSTLAVIPPAAPKKPRSKKPKMTLKKARAIKLINDAITRGKVVDLQPLLLQAGYSQESVRQFTNIMAGIKPHLVSTLDWLENHRRKIQEHMDEKVSIATYAELTRSLDVSSHYIQLLGGKPTHNIAISAEMRLRWDNALSE